MDAKKFIMGTLAGGVTLFLLGFVFYAVLFADFFANAAGSSAGAFREEPILWSIFVGEATMAGLVTLIFGRWAGIGNFMEGAKSGALIGLFVGVAINFIFYGTTTLSTITSALTDSVITIVRIGIAGGVIGLVLGLGAKNDS